MFETIFGLPIHPLVIHAVVVLMPLAAVSVLAAAVWPRFRRWAGPLPLILSVAATALVPVATQSGEWLQQAVPVTGEAIDTHSGLGEQMLYWGIGLVIAAALVYWLHRQTRRPADDKPAPKTPVVIAIVAVAVVASVGALVHIVRVGDSGSRAVWGYLEEQQAER